MKINRILKAKETKMIFGKRRHRKQRQVKRKLNEIPLEILSEIFNHLPRESLQSVGQLCKSFRNTVAFIIKKDFIDWKNEIDFVLETLKEAVTETLNNESIRWEICQKIGFLRVMTLHTNKLEAVIGRHINNAQTWSTLGGLITKILKEQRYLLNVLLNYPYFYKDIRPRYFNGNIPYLTNFFNKYFTEIQPFLLKINPIPYGVQLFNLLSVCPSSNIRILVFHPSDINISFVSMFFEIRGLGKKFEIEDFNYYKDENITVDDKFNKILFYLHHVIEHKNSEFLHLQMDNILNLESQIEYSMRERSTQSSELIEKLGNAYEIFLDKTYNDTYNNKAQFLYKDIAFYHHKIIREQETETSISNLVCNLKFFCNHEDLPDAIMITNNTDDITNEDKNIYTHEEENRLEMESIFQSVCQKLIVTDKNKNNTEKKNNVELDFDVFITYMEEEKQLLIVAKELHFFIINNEKSVEILLDDKTSGFDDYESIQID